MTRRDQRVAIVTGVIFVIAGLPKFVAFGWERDAFVSFDLPFPELLVVLAGIFEIGGGLLLIARRLLAPAALVLAGTMAVAFVASGLGHGDVLPSLTLAPALLAATVYLLVRSLRTAVRMDSSSETAVDRAGRRTEPKGMPEVFSRFRVVIRQSVHGRRRATRHSESGS